MTLSLHEIVAERGDLAFPHSSETFERLRDLSRSHAVDKIDYATHVTELIRTDPGFAFNVARLATLSGKPFGSGLPMDLPARVATLGATQVIAELGYLDSYPVAFEKNEALAGQFARIAACYTAAAREAGNDETVPKEWRDVAQLMVIAAAFPVLAYANLIPEEAVAVLSAPAADADATAESVSGFTIQELGSALADRYELPTVANPLYPGAVREAARRATEGVLERLSPMPGSDSASVA